MTIPWVSCPLCGFRFLAQASCPAGCPFRRGCQSLCCPNCHYRFVLTAPLTAKLVGWLRKRIPR